MKSILHKTIGMFAGLLTLGTAHAAAQAGSGTLDKVNETGTFTVGYRESSIPFSYLEEPGKPIGFSLDLCSHIVNRIKQQLNIPNLTVNRVAVTSSTRIPLVTNGTVDIECGGTANSLDRQKQVAFSVATFVSQTRWLVKASSGLESAAGLKGKTVVTTQGSNAVAFAHQINQREKLGLNIVQAKDHGESMLMLQTGRAAAFLEDDILLAGEKANARNPSDFKFLPDAYEVIYYGLMFRKDDPELKALVDSVLVGLMKSGEFDGIYRKWFESPIPPRGVNLQWPMSDRLKERVKNPSDKIGS